MRFRVIIKAFIYALSLTLCFLLVLNTLIRNESIWYFNIRSIPPPDQRPWYMKGGKILPTYNENRETNSYNLIFPEDYPDNDRIPQQLMLMPSCFDSISQIYFPHSKFLLT